MKIRIESNPWALPGPPIYIEGSPTPEKAARDQAEADEKMRDWAPDGRAFSLLAELQGLAGRTVLVQGWDPIMFLLEEEGPCPIRAKCMGTKTARNPDGLLQAYLVIKDPASVSSPDGYDDLGSLVPEGKAWLFDIGRLYEISSLDE
jgi:hypothetical protein